MNGNYKDISVLFDEVARIDDAKIDLATTTSLLRMEGDDRLEIPGYGSHPIEKMAHGQIAGALNIPKKYYDEMERIPGLRSHNVNEWFRAEPKRKMVRTLDGNARAFLSDKFKPYDNFTALKAALPVFNDFPDLQVKSMSLTESRMYLQIVFPRFEAEVVQGDPVQFGLTLRNSEVGAGAFAVEQLIWVLICGNGAVGQSVMSRYHVGRRIGSSAEETAIFADDTVMADVNAFQLKLRDVLKHTLSDTFFQAEVNKMKAAAEDKVMDPVETIENVTKKYGLSEDNKKDALMNLIQGGHGMSRWGVSNAITALSHKIANPDRQYEIERVGQDIIELKPGQWKEMVA